MFNRRKWEGVGGSVGSCTHIMMRSGVKAALVFAENICPGFEERVLVFGAGKGLSDCEMSVDNVIVNADKLKEKCSFSMSCCEH